MTALIVILSVTVLMLLAYSLCKVSGQADKMAEQIYLEELERRREKLMRKWEGK